MVTKGVTLMKKMSRMMTKKNLLSQNLVHNTEENSTVLIQSRFDRSLGEIIAFNSD